MSATDGKVYIMTNAEQILHKKLVDNDPCFVYNWRE